MDNDFTPNAEDQPNIGILAGMELDEELPEDYTIPATRAEAEKAVAEATGDESEPDDKPADPDDSDDSDPTESNPVEYVQDPGDFSPTDYSFEVTTYDEDNKNPKTHKIASAEDLDALLEAESNFGSAAALMKAQRMASKMELNTERDKAAWQTKKDSFDEAVKETEQRTQKLSTWQSEMDYLVEKGKLPKISAKNKTAQWTGDVLKDEGVAAQVELMKFMDKENAIRIKAGLAPMESVLDAYNALQLERGETKKPSPQVQQKKQADARKAAGAKIAGVSGSPIGQVPRGLAVGPGGSLDDLSRNNW